VPESIAHQTVAELGGSGSILARQRREHERLDVLLTRLNISSGTEQEATLTELGRLVFPHAFAEEAVLWPLARRTLPDGGELTLQVEKEHQEINELWTRLETTPHDDPERGRLVERITVLLQQDARDEEDALLPRLQEKLSTQELRRAGRAWDSVRRIAPTRPHPVVARRPPGNVLSALPLTLLDRTRDRLDGIARRSDGRVGTLAQSVSRRLAGTAGAVEKLPPMASGEDPDTASGRT
jgi:Hemerythrin HHE cation binding domain